MIVETVRMTSGRNLSLVETARLLTKQFFKAGAVTKILVVKVSKTILSSSSVMMIMYVKGSF